MGKDVSKQSVGGSHTNIANSEILVVNGPSLICSDRAFSTHYLGEKLQKVIKSHKGDIQKSRKLIISSAHIDKCRGNNTITL